MIPTGLGPRAEAIYNKLLLPMAPHDRIKHSDWRRYGSRSDLDSARRRLLREQARALEVERGVGYRMVPADEHERLARKHGDRARMQIKKGRKTITAVLEKRLDELTTQQAQTAQALEERYRAQDSALLAIQKRTERTEQAIASLQASTATRDELEEMRKAFQAQLDALKARQAA